MVGTPLENSQLPSAYQNVTPEKWKAANSGSLTTYGATAIAQVAPTNPNAELSTAIGEIYKDGLPALPGIRSWKRRTEILRAAADEFLNAEFGWLPLVSDITNVASSVRHSREILKQYHRDSGKNVRREFSFPVSEVQIPGIKDELREPTCIQQGTTGFPNFINITKGFGPIMMSQSIKVSTRRWFSGCFTYTVPSQSDSWSKTVGYGSDADKLFGITLTPNVLWELTPWSWAADWFTNAGDVINNVNNFASQGLIMRYGYMMEESIVKVTHTFTGERNNTNSAWGTIPPSSYSLVSKRRVAANPFGFGVTPGSLSPTQVAIAAALGILLV